MGDQERLVQKHYLDLWPITMARRPRPPRSARSRPNKRWATCAACWGRPLRPASGRGRRRRQRAAQLDRGAFAGELDALEISPSGIHAIEARRLPALKDTRLFDGYHIPYPDKSSIWPSRSMCSSTSSTSGCCCGKCAGLPGA